MTNRKTIQWSTEKKHEGDKPYNGQQKENTKERNHTMVNRKKNHIERNHTMVNRKKTTHIERNHTIANRKKPTHIGRQWTS